MIEQNLTTFIQFFFEVNLKSSPALNLKTPIKKLKLKIFYESKFQGGFEFL